jgi:hypothetical protein
MQMPEDEKNVGYGKSNGSPTHARRPLRTIPLVPLDSPVGVSTRKESAQAVWSYAGDTDAMKPVRPNPLTPVPELNEASSDESFIQARIQPMQRARVQQSYPQTDEQNVRRVPPTRQRRLIRTNNAHTAAINTTTVRPNIERTQVALRLPTTAPLSGNPYDRLLPAWQVRRKRDTIFLVLLTLLVLSILGIMSCNYLLSLYHI